MRTSSSICFLLGTVLVAASVFCSRGLAQETRPNIIFILADDLGKGDLSPRLMPRSDALRQQKGTTLNFYAMQNCTPARTALLTGKHPYRFNLHSVHPTALEPGIPVEEKLLPAYMSEAGYSTAMFGKWHLGWQERAQWPNAKGFDEFIGCLGGHMEYFGSVGTGFPYADGTTGHDHHSMHDLQFNGIPLYSPKYSTFMFRDAAIEFIKQKTPQDEPYFLYVSFNAPHGPISAPRSYVERAAALPDIDSSRMHELAEYEDEVLSVPGTNPTFEFDIAPLLYSAAVMAMDDAVADIYAQVEASGEADNTLFLFASDNGPGYKRHPVTKETYTLGDTGGLKGTKGSFYEGGYNTANFLVWPQEIAPGKVVDDNIWIADLTPTFLELAGVETPPDLDGGSAVEALKHNESIWRRGFGPFVASHVVKKRPPNRHPNKTLTAVAYVTLNYQRLKYIRYTEFDADENANGVVREWLYDLSVDPEETANLAANPERNRDLELMRIGFQWLGGDPMLETLHTFGRTSYPWNGFNPTDEFGFYDNPIPLRTSIAP